MRIAFSETLRGTFWCYFSSSSRGGFCRAGVSGLILPLGSFLEAVDIFRVISIFGVGTAGERAWAEGFLPEVPEIGPQNKAIKLKLAPVVTNPRILRISFDRNTWVTAVLSRDCKRFIVL